MNGLQSGTTSVPSHLPPTEGMLGASDKSDSHIKSSESLILGRDLLATSLKIANDWLSKYEKEPHVRQVSKGALTANIDL